MYYNRSNFAPRAINGLMEDVFQNGLNRVFFDDKKDYSFIPVNIQETDKSYELHVVAPGLKKEDFKLSIDKNVLNISFEQKEENKEENTKWLRNEYRFRSFKRSFTLNDKVNTNNISAKYNDGILNITLPKKEVSEATAKDIVVG